MLGYRKQKVKMTTEVQYDRLFIWIWIILELQICKQKKNTIYLSINFYNNLIY
jgi:hypothetical protein